MDVDSPMVRIRSIMTRKPHGVLDIDAIKDPLTCSEYAQDVIDYLQVFMYIFISLDLEIDLVRLYY